MAEFKLNRIRFTWKGDWATATVYTKDDIVRYGGKSYVCLVGHTSAANFYIDFDYINTATEPDIPAPKWELWFDGYDWKNTWEPETFYKLGDLVRYNGIVYVCTQSHTSSLEYLEKNILDINSDGTEVTVSFSPVAVAPYEINQPIILSNVTPASYNGNYIVTDCTTSTVKFDSTNIDDYTFNGVNSVTSAGTAFEGSQTHVNVLQDETSGAGTNAVFTVIRNNGTYSVTVTSGGYDFQVDDTITIYGTRLNGEIPTNDLTLTVTAIDGPTGKLSVVSNLGLEVDAGKWISYARVDNWRASWAVNTRYRTNDIVNYSGILYRCLTGHTSAYTSEEGLEVDSINWTSVTDTENWTQDWVTDHRYIRNNVVRYGGIVYKCTNNHHSALTIELGLEADLEKWTVVSSGVEFKGDWTQLVRYKLNDVVKYGAGIWKCVDYHVSDTLFGPLKWESYIPGFEYGAIWDETTDYQPGDVVKHGGYSYYSVNHNTNSIPSLTNVDWNLLTVGFRMQGEWGNAIQYYTGDTVRKNGQLYVAITNNQGQETTNAIHWQLVIPGEHWKNFWSVNVYYALGDVVTYLATSYKCIQEHTSSVLNNPLVDVTNTYWVTYIEGDTGNRMETYGDILTYDAGNTAKYPIGDDKEILKVTTDLPNWHEFSVIGKVYYISTSGIDDEAHGLTLNSPWRTVKYACEHVTGPATIFIKTGIYEEELPISIPADVALVGDELRSTTIMPLPGFQTEDMFYVRNGTGIRNMTLKGLSGTLGDLNSYGTRRPTAGAFVSLDPGQNASDSSVWITTKSPYVQNVTTFGTGCVGLKVDGALHNGGNKSVVANDFTQVISDGIGAWVTNLGLSELVSVFSYYGHIGYLAENGGKIRATNGNSSYGTYGCASEGVDTTETPVTGTVNNRSEHAQVAAVFAGQANDQILALEYSHAGQNYTTAAYNFTGAGVGVLTSFGGVADHSVSEVRILQPTETSNAGGGGYLIVGNNSQGGDDLTIYIAANDQNTETEYLGMRIIITSGTGVGQYGYIQAYDDVSKLVTVYQESTGLAGWDHIVSGTPIEVLLDTTTYYQIEPRVAFSAPGIGGGVQTLGRAIITSGRIGEIRLWEPGANYPYGTVSSTNSATDRVFVNTTTGLLNGQPIEFTNVGSTGLSENVTYYIIGSSIVAGTAFQVSDTQFGSTPVQLNTASPVGMTWQTAPILTVTDPNNNSEVIVRCRMANGVLKQPIFNDRGIGYQTSTTVCTITGDGFADIYQDGKFLVVEGMSRIPGPGANLQIESITGTIYKMVTITDLGSGNALIRLSPELKIFNSPLHGIGVEIRENYSQVRLTGHDFLDIGTGNFENTNYPYVNDLLKAPENEILEEGGGRVFYTSTDQDGNFRCGELFKVEQSTGTVTISADFFQLTGLEELSLGGVSIGGSAVVVREFSTDITFTADSNNVVPTQRAIKAYLARRISGGGADAQTGQLVAGTVRFGPQKIDTTTLLQVNVPVTMNIKKGIDGSMLAMSYFADSFSSNDQ